MVSNEEIKITPFIPPQLFNRYVNLSKNTFHERKNNTNLQTQIRVVDEDLILLVKNKGDKDQSTEPNLDCMRKLAEIDMIKNLVI